MNTTFAPTVGGVLSADIAVPEHDRELRFYSHVLGTGEHPLWQDDLTNNRGMPVIGLGPTSAEYGDLPLQWMPHIQVADVAASAKRALDLDGTELLHGRNDEGNSEWAVLLDPNGAAFGIIPVVPADALPRIEGDKSGAASARMGCISWLDLTVNSASETCEFYRQVIGWSVHIVEMEDADERYTDYQMCSEDGIPLAGVRQARGVNLGLPPVWMIHLPVGDLGESLRRVREEGGRIVKAKQQTDGEFAYAAVEDPVGAHFALVPGGEAIAR